MPTRLGNILRACEHYPNYMFGIEPITTWYRLVAVIPEAYRNQLEHAEAATQFFLNLSFVSVLISGIALYESVETQSVQAARSMNALALVLIALAYLTYRLACSAALNWSEHVRSAFDLYRFDLLKQLSVATPERPPWSMAVERQIWKRVQGVTFYAQDDAAAEYVHVQRPGSETPKA